MPKTTVTLADVQAGRVTVGMMAEANVSLLEQQLRGGKSRAALVQAKDYEATRAALRKGEMFGTLTNYRTKELVLCPKEPQDLLRDLVGKACADEFERIYRSDRFESDTVGSLMHAADRERWAGRHLRLPSEHFSIEDAERYLESAGEFYGLAKAHRNAARISRVREKVGRIKQKDQESPVWLFTEEGKKELSGLPIRGLDEKLNL